MADSVYWVGGDGNVYYGSGRDGAPVQNVGKPINLGPTGFDAEWLSAQNSTRIVDPVNPNDGGGGGGNYDPYAAQRAEAARQKAAEEKQAAELRTGITGTIGNLQNSYNQLFGDISTAGQSQKAKLDERYGRETRDLGDQFNSEFPRIGKAYAGRGAYSSSYRQDAENTAQQQFSRQLEDIRLQRKNEAEKIGQYVAEQQAKIQGQQGLLNSTLGRLGGYTNVSDLMALRNKIDEQLAEVTASRAGAQSRDAYMQRFAELAPATDRMNNLRATLSNIINGAAPGPIKQQMVEQIIGSAGLNPDEQDVLKRDLLTQIG